MLEPSGYEHESEVRSKISKLKELCPSDATVEISFEKVLKLHTVIITINHQECKFSEKSVGLDLRVASLACFTNIHEDLRLWKKERFANLLDTA